MLDASLGAVLSYMATALARARAKAIEECANVVKRHRPDASFDDSSVGYMERHALLKNIENEIRELGLDS